MSHYMYMVKSSYNIRFSSIHVYTQSRTQGMIGGDLATPFQVMIYSCYISESAVALSMYRVGTHSSTHETYMYRASYLKSIITFLALVL